MPNLTGLLAGFSGFPQGLMEAQAFQQQQQLAQQRAAIQQLAMQQAQEQQRAQDIGFKGLLNQPQMQAQPMQTQPSPQIPMQTQSPLPQVPQMGGAMGAAPQPPAARQAGTFGGMGSGLPSLPSLIAQMESSGGADTASQPPSMADKTYGQYPGFAQDYGTGPGGVMNFAQRVLREQPNATVGDFYANYVLNTGGTSKTTADLQSTPVPGAQGAYRNMETKLASAGVSDTTPLANLVQNGQMGVPSAAFVRQGAPVPTVKNAADIGAQATYGLPMNQYGMLDIPSLAKAIDQAAPDESGHVKMMALGNIIKLAAPEERLAYQQIMLQNRQAFQQGIKDEEIKARFGLLNARIAAGQGDVGKGGSMYQPTDEQGKPMGQPMWVAQGKATPISGLPEGAAGGAKVGAKPIGSAQTGMPEAYKYPENWEGMPNTPPPGIREDVWDTALYFARTHQMPALGMQPGMRSQVIQAYPAALHALGIQPASAPDVAAAYAGEKHGEIVGGGRAAQISLGINEALKAAPQVLQTSANVPRTQFPPLNQFQNWLAEKGGDPNIVAFRDALNTYLNVYASVVSRTGRLTDAQQKHAYDLLSTSFNQGQINRGIEQLNYEMQLMKEAVPPAMEDIKQIGQPPALQQRGQPAVPPISGMGLSDIQALINSPQGQALTPDQLIELDKRVDELKKHGQ